METRRPEGGGVLAMRRTAGNSGPGKCGVLGPLLLLSLIVRDFFSTGGQLVVSNFLLCCCFEFEIEIEIDDELELKLELEELELELELELEFSLLL